jgi:DNA-binding winged helix-turn-helix (wHTH) protein
MPEQRILIFEPFCLDVGNERLWRGPEALHLTHKAFAVLRYLAEHAGQLVTKDELLEVVWSQTHVSEAALAVCIREIRQAVGDHPRTPRCIETVHGRGYRFMAPVTVADPLPSSLPLPRRCWLGGRWRAPRCSGGGPKPCRASGRSPS